LTEIPMAGEGTQPSRSGKRPFGVTLIAVLEFLLSVILLAAGIGLQAGGWFLSAMGLVLVAIGLAGIFLCVGLLNLRSWAWTGVVVLDIVALIISLANQGWPGVVLSLIIVLYLFQPDIKARFS